MPSNVVKTEAQEKAWKRAKRIVKKQYPHIKEGTVRFYKLVMTVYKSLIGQKGSRLEKVLG